MIPEEHQVRTLAIERTWPLSQPQTSVGCNLRATFCNMISLNNIAVHHTWAVLILAARRQVGRECESACTMTASWPLTGDRYIHWSLPQLYRTGVAGASGPDSVNATRTAKLYGGYGQDNYQNGNSLGTPSFRSIPERWVIMRTIRPAVDGSSAGHIRIGDRDTENDAPSSLYNQVAGDQGSIRNLFIIQSVS